MTALKPRDIPGFLKKRDPAIACVLLYGPDAGLVRERAEQLARKVTTDFKDPFNYLELTDTDIKAEPGRLADEAAALSFAGGERVVRLKTAGETSAKAAGALIDGLDGGYIQPNALVIIEAGELTAKSGLRKRVENAGRAAALPCYADEAADVSALAVEMAKAEGLTIDDDALALIVSLLGEDRGVTRSELNKLILYKGPKGTREPENTGATDLITLEDVTETLVDGVGDAMDAAAAATADGAPGALERALYRSAAAGASPIGFLRALQRQFMRLNAAQEFMARGESPAGAMKKLRPPVFFKEQRAFEMRLRAWTPAKLAIALDQLIGAEMDAKTTGAPQREIIERTALRLCMMVKR